MAIQRSARRVALALLSVMVGFVAANAVAQSFPARPITLVVPYGPGTGIDLVARIIAQKVSESRAFPMVVENKPGATGGIGMEIVAKATADGHVLVIASNSQILNQLVSPARYDIGKEFAPVSLVGSQRSVLAVTYASPARSVNDLVALAKSRPGKLSYAATTASTFHFMGEMLKSARGIDLVMIPYKSSPDAEADLISGRIDVLFTSMATALPLVKAGKARVLGITGEKRVAALPDVPTMTEAGLPTLDVNFPLYILAPVATPRTTLGVLNGAIVKAIESSDVRERFAATWLEPRSSTPEELGAFLKGEISQWSRIVKESGIRLE